MDISLTKREVKLARATIRRSIREDPSMDNLTDDVMEVLHVDNITARRVIVELT